MDRARARQARGLDFEAQLVARAGGLGRLLRGVHALCQDDTLQEACSYYLAFARFVHGQGSEALADRLACLRRLAAGALAPQDEPEAASAALEIELDAAAMMMMGGGDDDGASATDLDGLAADMGVDWGIEVVGDAGAAAAAAADIDGDGGPAAATEPVEIDWGAEFETTDAAQESATAAAAPLMTWDERHALLTDLLELECFLLQRQVETKEAGNVGQVGSLRQLLQQHASGRGAASDAAAAAASDDAAAAAASDDAAAAAAAAAATTLVSSGGAPDLSRWISAVRAVLAALRDDPSLQQLLVISRGGMGLAAMVTGFERLRRKYDKSVRGIDALRTERLRLAEEARRQRPVIDFYRKKIARTKSVVEAGLTQHFDGRQIHLVGDLNTV